MPLYDDAMFSPPAPVARVALINPASGQALEDVPMLLDTGADTTLIPQRLVGQLGIKIDSSTSYELVGFDGSHSVSGAVQIHLRIQSFLFRGKFLVVNGEVGIVGRDLLNYLTLTLDGKRLSWEMTNS